MDPSRCLERQITQKFQIKIVRNPDDDEQLAYVNFERPDCAKKIRRTMIPKLQSVLGRKLTLDPTGVLRDQEGTFYSTFFIFFR